MAKYIFKRLVYGLFSILVVVTIVMIMVFSLLNRDLVFSTDSTYSKLMHNQKTTYKYAQWEKFGYLEYLPYADYINEKAKNGEIDEEVRSKAATIGRTPDKDNEVAKQYMAEFEEYCKKNGFTTVRLDAVMAGRKVANGGGQAYFAYKEIPLTKRLVSYLSGLFTFDNIHKVENIVGERKLSFTLHDPVYGGEKLSPAIIGNGTVHKYLLYFDNKFPYVHQNFLSLNLGTSYSVNQGVDVFTTMTQTQGSYVKKLTKYETGLEEESADDLHTATYIEDSREGNVVKMERFNDDYTDTLTVKSGKSKMGYSFVIGIISVIGAYILGIPLGVLMARKKDKLVDKLGTIYIVFIIAVPSLAYIFLFKAIGGLFKLPTTFDMESTSKLIYILPIVSLALPSIGNLMKWMRRYMVDQMNADYVKFARSGGLSESEIFSKHILKNAAIPIVHGIPGSVLGALVGAIITERVYVVPGAGNLLTQAINRYDNNVIVGVTLFYATLTVLSVILGDVFMSLVDPRISFSTKDR